MLADKRLLIDKVASLIHLMTVEEKIAQLGAYWVYDLQSKGKLDTVKIQQKLKNGIGQITRNAGACNLMPLETARSANRLQKFLKEETRLGIPAIIHEECCAGVMSAGSTIFPQMIGLASTFRPELAEQMTTTIRHQMRAVGAHQGLAPVLDVARDPRWGRVEETFGEDPSLVSQFGVAYIKGLQSEDLSNGVMATGKHFVGHSFSQGGLNCGPVHLGPRDLWDTYLLPFQAAIRDAGLASMMNAYPELDGEVVAASRRILTGLLRETLGFDGVVVSDYEAITMIHNYHFAAETRREAAVKALNAGIDVELPSVTCYGEDLLQALKAGEISMDTIDLSVSRHLQKKFELGLFDDPFVDEGSVLSVYETNTDRDLAYEIACQSLVLLKNDGTLPLQKNLKSIAVIGPNADSSRNLMGDYSFTAVAELLTFMPDPNSAFATMTQKEVQTPSVYVPTILEAITKAAGSTIKVTYEKGCEVDSQDESGFKKAIQAASQAEVVILVMGGRSGLTLENTTGEFRDATDLGLPGVQEKLITVIVDVGKPTVLVLNNGRPAAIPEIVEKTNAILEAWIPGEEGARAVADALFGKVNPGGKLPISIPRSAGQVPVFYNHKPSGMRSNIFGDYYNEPVKPLFPFGHGLSYASFQFSHLSINKSTFTPEETINISLQIKNTSEIKGDEVVQLYMHDEVASLPRPVKELKDFKRVTLTPGESKTITFHMQPAHMAYYDENLELMIEPGKFKVMIGSSSEDIRLEGEFRISGNGKSSVEKRVYQCLVEVSK
jgi:beta-glucosidase